MDFYTNVTVFGNSVLVRGIKNGERITLRQSLIRNILRFVDGIGLYLVGLIFLIVKEDNQRIGDLAANTIVVRS